MVWGDHTLFSGENTMISYTWRFLKGFWQILEGFVNDISSLAFLKVLNSFFSFSIFMLTLSRISKGRQVAFKYSRNSNIYKNI